MVLSKPETIPLQMQQKIDFREERIAENNLNLVSRVRSQYDRKFEISRLDNSEYVERQKEARMVNQLLEEQEIAANNANLSSRIINSKSAFGVDTLEKQYQKRRQIQKMHGQVIDFQKEMPPIVEKKKQAQISGARGKLQKPELSLVQQQKMRLYKSRTQ